jgi:antirestriction protein ArdC
MNAEQIVHDMPQCPAIINSFDRAYYDPQSDIVNVPQMSTFLSEEAYYSTLFHELIHSTGHEERIGRKGVTEKIIFGSESYSQEELIAEIGACYLKGIAGIESGPTDNNIGYIQSWLKVFHGNKKMIVFASSHAQKAVDYILNVEWQKKDEEASISEIEVQVEEVESIPEKKKRIRKNH